MATVYFFKDTDNLKAGLDRFIKIIKDDWKKDERTGLKIHFGEEKNDTHISPRYLSGIEKEFKYITFIETNTLYKGKRTTKTDHINTARMHGFDFLDIDILDGELGDEYIEVPINTKNTKIAYLGKSLKNYDRILCMNHFKGHIVSGFGGAIKNLSMGLGSRKGKLDMHASFTPPTVNEDKCICCNKCIDGCNFNAIEMRENSAFIMKERCTGCAMCISVCPTRAVMIPWAGNSSEKVMEKMAEYALAATKDKDIWHINFLNNITYGCDCMNEKQKPFMRDIGILLSKDPVAIDQASLDLIKKNHSKDPFIDHNHIDGKHQLEYAESIGLGKREYELKEI